MLILRMTRAELDAYSIAYDSFFNKGTFYDLEFDRILYHLKLTKYKKPKVAEIICNHVQGSNIYGETGISVTLTPPCAGLFQHGYFGFIYTSLVYLFVIIANWVLKNIAISRNFFMLAILSPLAIKATYIISQGNLIGTLWAFIEEVGRNCITLSLFLILYFLFCKLKDFFSIPIRYSGKENIHLRECNQ